MSRAWPRGCVGSGADIGFSFDGDGDRVLAVDREGKVHDGDEIIAFVATDRAARGTLGGGVVVTVMTNYGFHQAMERERIDVEVTSVGDRYVLEALREKGWLLGGEQSGHIISTDYAPTGDGIAAALMLLEALDGRDLAGAAVMEEAAPDPGQRHGRRPRGDRRCRCRLGGGRAGEPRARRQGPGAGPPVGNRAAGPRHGRGTDPGRGRGGLRRTGALVENELG